jgi:hypothetical protein
MSSFAATVGECKRIEISFLRKQGYLEQGCIRSGTLSWSRNGQPTGSISISSSIQPEEAYIRLVYSITDRNGEKTDIDYRIDLVSVPSNLGWGNRWYFLCPFTFKRCSILYKVPDSYYWKHREAFTHFYYESQLTAASCKPFMFMVYERKQQELLEGRKRVRRFYKGKPTRLQQRLENYDRKTFSNLKANQSYYLSLTAKGYYE